MYESFFHLTGKPFQLNPDPRFFYRSKGHKRALAYMRYGLQQEQGFIVVTGDVGTGKTMLVNNLFREIEEQGVVAAKIVSTNLKDVDLLRLIAAELDIAFERVSKATLLHALEEYFKSCRAEGKRVLLVIDEAQNLPRSALEELRMLSNFDHGGTPLVQSFLLGQREFRGILRAPGLEQLRQRVIAAYHLKPLSAPEVKAYIEHRMRKVGWDGDPSIEEPVYERIYQATGGVPRRINTLCDRVLLNCYLDESHAITLATVEAVCQEIEAEQGDAEIEPEQRPAGVETHAPLPPGRNTADEVARLEQRVQSMQRTIDSLSSRLIEANTRPSALDNTRPGLLEQPPPRFPLWTAAFLSLLAVAAVLGISIGVWVMRN
jgi:putative secretion ATPase (PEP-CTERM system associated)